MMIWVPMQMELSSSGGGMRLMQILHPFVSLGSSILLGFGTGIGLHNVVNWKPIAPIAKQMPSSVGPRQAPPHFPCPKP